MSVSPADKRVAQLVQQLESARQAAADAPVEGRKQALEQALNQALQAIPADEADAVIGAARERVVSDARARSSRIEELEQRVAALVAENQQLKSAGAPPAAAPPVASSGDSDSLNKIRQGLIQITDSKKATPESLGLADSEARLFRLIQELLQFALGYEMGVNMLLGEFKVGPAAQMNTIMMKGFKQVVRDRFRACLDNKEGSIEALKETLTRNSGFVVALNKAYTSSIAKGTQSLLGEMDPEPILESKRRMMGVNYENAWNKIIRLQSDLSGLSSNELWERFFFEHFRDKLAQDFGDE
jgi:hypothetical protein